jgi:hypothetical protein
MLEPAGKTISLPKSQIQPSQTLRLRRMSPYRAIGCANWEDDTPTNGGADRRLRKSAVGNRRSLFDSTL